MSHPDKESLQTTLTEIFQELVSIEVLSERLQEQTRFVVCNMSYRRSSGDNSSRRVRQTAVVFQAEELQLPQFALAPQHTGLLGKLAGSLIGAMDLNFEDSPEFSESYYLHGWNEEAVRALFTWELRQHFAAIPGWSVRGNGSSVIVFRQNSVCADEDLDQFVGDAIEILSLFRDAESQLDQMPQLQRETNSHDIRRQAQQMGGLAGAMLSRQLDAIAVSPTELEEFLAEPEPRTPPPGLKRQVVGDTFILIPLGVIFFLVGLILGGVTVFTAGSSTQRGVGLLFLCMFPLIGALMAGLTLRHRTRKMRLLRRGIKANGTVTSVKQSSVMVNDQVRYVVTFEYHHNGDELTATSSVDGPKAPRAREAMDAKEPLRILIDPADETHIICADLLTVFE